MLIIIIIIIGFCLLLFFKFFGNTMAYRDLKHYDIKTIKKQLVWTKTVLQLFIIIFMVLIITDFSFIFIFGFNISLLYDSDIQYNIFFPIFLIFLFLCLLYGYYNYEKKILKLLLEKENEKKSLPVHK